MAKKTPQKLVQAKSSVCRCCNGNLIEARHPIDLYGPNASNESITDVLERFTGFKCNSNDGLSTKLCHPCYDKIQKFKNLCDVFAESTRQQESMKRFKRGKTQSKSPLVKPTGHTRKRPIAIQAWEFQGRFYQPHRFPTTVKQRLLPRGILPEPPRKSVEILAQSGLHNPSLS